MPGFPGTVTPSQDLIDGSIIGSNAFTLTLDFGTAMDTSVNPGIGFPNDDPSVDPATLEYNHGEWISSTTFVAYYDVYDYDVVMDNVTLIIVGAKKADGTPVPEGYDLNGFDIDTTLTDNGPTVTPSVPVIDNDTTFFTLSIVFREEMDTSFAPSVEFPEGDLSEVLVEVFGEWVSGSEYVVNYQVMGVDFSMQDIDVFIYDAFDNNGHPKAEATILDVFSIETQAATILSITPSEPVVTISTSTFELTLEFSRSMDTSVNPSLSFEPDISHILVEEFGEWISSTTFFVSYSVVGGSAIQDDITVNLEFAQDETGTPLAFTAFPNVFSINLDDPTVLDIMPSHPVASMDPPFFELIVEFGQEMDTTVDPTLSFDQDLSGSLVLANTLWINGTTFAALYDMADADVALADIDVTVEGALTLAGNAVPSSEFLDVFSVKTSDPTVLSVTPSDLVINAGVAAGGTFTLAIAFSDEMVPGSPIIEFPVEDPSVTLTFLDGEWVSGNLYVATFSVSTTAVTLADIDVRVSDTLDAFGNPLVTADIADVFSIDTGSASAQSANVVSFNPFTGILTYVVQFDEAVTGVDASDFSLTTIGWLSGTSIQSVTGSGTTWTVQIQVGYGLGIIRLNVLDDNTIQDLGGNPLGGSEEGDGAFSGQAALVLRLW